MVLAVGGSSELISRLGPLYAFSLFLPSIINQVSLSIFVPCGVVC